MADVTSFALPLGGGERNCFKVTLVLSFTMFVIILNNELPGDGRCNPIIRQSDTNIHMLPNGQNDGLSCWPSVCLSVLQEPTSVFAWSSWCLACWCPWCWQGLPQKETSFLSAVPNVQLPNAQQTRRRKKMKVRRTRCSHSLRFRHRFFWRTVNTLWPALIAVSIPTEAKADISVVPPDASEEHTRMLRNVVNFLEGLGAQQLKRDRYQKIAKRIDEIFFWFYLFFGSIYFFAMTYVMVNYTCNVNHFDFWY